MRRSHAQQRGRKTRFFEVSLLNPWGRITWYIYIYVYIYITCPIDVALIDALNSGRGTWEREREREKANSSWIWVNMNKTCDPWSYVYRFEIEALNVDPWIVFQVNKSFRRICSSYIYDMYAAFMTFMLLYATCMSDTIRIHLCSKRNIWILPEICKPKNNRFQY